MHAATVLLGPDQSDRSVGLLLEHPRQVVVVDDADLAGAGRHRIEQCHVVGVDVGVVGPAPEHVECRPPRRRRRSCWRRATAGSRCWRCACTPCPSIRARRAPRRWSARRRHRSGWCCRRSCGCARRARTSGRRRLCSSAGIASSRIVELIGWNRSSSAARQRLPASTVRYTSASVSSPSAAIRSRSSASLPVRNSTLTPVSSSYCSNAVSIP